MIVNLYVDHMLATPPASSEQVYAATQEHAKLFDDAAARIGLTPAEYREFQRDLLDGKVSYVRLPRRLDAMSGNRHGSVYAVHNAVMTTPVMGWRVALADGNVVYVPQACGNISLLRHGALAVRPKPAPVVAAAHTHRRPGAAFVPAVGPAPAAAVPPGTPVSLVPPEQAVPAAEAPAQVAQVAPIGAAAAAAHGPFAGLFALPFLLAGAVVGATHHSNVTTPPAVVPPCTGGSNALNACQTK